MNRFHALEKQRTRKNVPAHQYTVKMNDPDNVVEFDNLQSCFFTEDGVVEGAKTSPFPFRKEKLWQLWGSRAVASLLPAYP